uniref:Lysosome membrane protein 2 n=2 Tax=Cacopsylla melanoneura TaxID=428564 RepID=A0A8D8LWG0_9HEMI
MKSFTMKENVPEKKKKHPYCDLSMLLIVFSVIFFCALSVLLWCTNFYNTQLFKFLIIKNDSYLFDSWIKPPVSPLVCIYAFNYTNTDHVLKGYTDKLIVNEVGPYCYRESTQKMQVQFYPNGTVSYRDNRTHQFVPELSKGKRDDKLVIPNVPFFVALAMVRNLGYISQIGIMSVLGGQQPFPKVKAHDSFFGYDNAIVTLASTISKLMNKPLPYDKCGLLLSRSGLSKDRIMVWTGETNPESAGQVVNVNGVDTMTAWTAGECNMVHGSDGSRFPPTKVGKKEPVSIFSRDSCRRLPLIFHTEGKFQKEIPSYKYTIDPDYFKSRTFNNSCYCTTTSECSYDGVFDISACADGAPILISQPHFLNGDKTLMESLEGLHPDKDKHDFFMDIHPRYGLTMGMVSRIQLNVEVKKPDSSRSLDSLPDGLILPLIWMEISSETMPDHMFSLIQHATFTVRYLELFLQWQSLILFTIASICFTRRTTAYIMQ